MTIRYNPLPTPVCFCLLLISFHLIDHVVVVALTIPPRPSASSHNVVRPLTAAAPERSNDVTATSTTSPHVIFPGGGLFFYWQGGFITYMRDKVKYSVVVPWSSTGASAGALVATLTACNVDFHQATDLALDLSRQAGIWDRPLGLQGVWGTLIYQWLDELLPPDAATCLEQNRVTLLVTPANDLFGKKEQISTFSDREEVIAANMASVHIPWFLDGKLTTSVYRQQDYIDGSFLAQPEDFIPEAAQRSPIFKIDHKMDPVYGSATWYDFVKTISPTGIWKMLDDGKAFAKHLDETGKLDELFEGSVKIDS